MSNLNKYTQYVEALLTLMPKQVDKRTPYDIYHNIESKCNMRLVKEGYFILLDKRKK